MARFVVLCVVAVVLAGCGSSAPATASPSVVPASSTFAPSSAPPSVTASLPVFAADEPLLLYGKVTGAGGGVFVMRPDGSDRTQLATDVLPGIHKRGGWSPDGQHVVFIDESTEYMWIAHLDGSPTTRVSACDSPGCDYPAW